MKRRELSAIIDTLEDVSELKGAKFAICLLKNRKEIEKQIEEDRKNFETLLKPSEKFEKYDKLRVDLCVLHSEKDENGEPVIEDEKYIIGDSELFDIELDKLSKTYDITIQKRKKQIEEYQKIMEEDIDITFHQLDIEDIPNDISEIQLRGLEFMLNLD